eukprot:COSAG05_NODE_4507_length_1484_cov_26.297536_1_plen_149_part_10
MYCKTGDRSTKSQTGGGTPGLIRWLEEFSRRLATGCYSCPPSHHPQFSARQLVCCPEALRSGLSLFPLHGTAHARGLSQGVEGRLSVIYAAEHDAFLFQLSLRLLGQASEGDGYVDAAVRGFDTCQLRSLMFTNGVGEHFPAPDNTWSL